MSGPTKRTWVVGFVCEGSTDVVVLRALVEAVAGPIEARALQPATDELDRTLPGVAAGWSEVKAWCERLSSYEDYFHPPVGDPLDALVIALDLDIAVRAGLQQAPANLKAYDAKTLCKIVKSWLPKPLHGKVIIAIPVMSVEAWVLAALLPRFRRPEQELAPAGVLVAKRKMEMGSNGPWKRATEYREFAKVVASKRNRVEAACTEARRFVQKVERLRASCGPPQPPSPCSAVEPGCD